MGGSFLLRLGGQKMENRQAYVGLRLPSAERQKLEFLAAATDRTLSGVIRQLIRNAALADSPDLKLTPPAGERLCQKP